ncbi:hypothetical protein [Roseomonas fluvialis]|uniref:DUF4439 domain-containing protein n=1 Tax=Roseomonas fluvialis TaxID=1750527 RepID=A0ABM7Y3E9_9PROT|nr:hypothetical protein [Roseomonas fluvialis]BDG72331.1 hypothetical protein Rmf_22600 [Roseomonas fluvialis]
MTLRRRVLLGALTLPACAELRTPAALPPGVLASAPGTGAPLRAAVFATAAAFANQGAALQGQPAEAALAIARLEALEIEVADRRAWPALSPSVGFAMRTARDETRAALGIAQRAPGADVVRALALVASRLRAGNRAGAVDALPATLFEPGGEATLDRLAAIGPLPAAEQATAALARDVRRLDLDRGWAGAGNWWQAGAPGAITDGLGLGE